MAVGNAWIVEMETEGVEQPVMPTRANVHFRPSLGVPSAVFLVVVYLALGIAAHWSALSGISDHFLGVTPDFTISAWYLGWVPHALGHGLNPWFSYSMFAPNGVNLAEATEGPLLGLIVTPLATVLGPVARANLLLILAMPVSATAAFVVLRRWNIWFPSAAIGGLIYGFSPYMMGQAVDHTVLAFVPLPPFIALVVVAIIQHKQPRLRLGVWLGVLIAAQFLISPEVLASVGIMTVIALVVTAVRRPRLVRERTARVTASVGIAVAVSAVLMAYPVWMMLDGPQHFRGSTYPASNPYHNDLFSFVVPAYIQKLSLGLKSIGGYSDHPDANGLPILFPTLMSPPDLQQFLASQDGFNPYGRPLPFGPQLVEETRRTLTQYGIGAVIVDRSVSGSGPVVQLFTDAMGAPKVSAGQFSLWLRQ